jgi:hypothetical protein
MDAARMQILDQCHRGGIAAGTLGPQPPLEERILAITEP